MSDSSAPTLRFTPELEQEFRQYQRETVLVQRLALLLIGAALISCMPFFDAFLLHPPEDFIPQSRRIQFGLILPALLLAFAFTADRRLRRWADVMGICALTVVIAGWIYQRYLGAQYGYDLPALLIAVIISGTLSLSGLLFRSAAPVAALGLLLFAGEEIWSFGLDESSGFRVLLLCLLALVTAVAGYLHEAQARSLWLQRHAMQDLARKDSLTGLLNRRAFNDAFAALVRVAAQRQTPLLVAVVDIDHFKELNDRAGHLAGDQCLQALAGALTSGMNRATDLTARLGGEEFGIVWHDVPRDGAETVLARLRERVEQVAPTHPAAQGDNPSKVTVSIGAVWVVPGGATQIEDILASADERMYESKRLGRDRVTLSFVAEAHAASRGEEGLPRADASDGFARPGSI